MPQQRRYPLTGARLETRNGPPGPEVAEDAPSRGHDLKLDVTEHGQDARLDAPSRGHDLKHAPAHFHEPVDGDAPSRGHDLKLEGPALDLGLTGCPLTGARLETS